MVRIATVADHVVAHRGDWNSFRLGALQSLCDQCHNKIKKRMELHGDSSEQYSRHVGIDGWPIDQRHPIYQRNRSRS